MSSKRGGGVLGFEYEILVPAYFSLLLDNDETIEDFCFRTNESSQFDKLDDLVIETRTKRGEEINFAIQLKHLENKILQPNFVTNGKLSLEPYCLSFKQMSREHQKYNHIIYTTATFDRAKMNEIKEFKMSEREEFAGSIFNSSADKRNIYKFEMNENTPESDNVNREDYEKFLPRLSLFVCQKNVRKFREEIENFLKKDVSNKDVWLKYVDLFRLWRHKEFTNNRIDKAVVNYHLMNAFLWPHVIRNYHFSNDSRLQLFKDAIREFDVSIIKESKDYFQNKLVKCNILDLENDPLGVKNSLKYYMNRFNINQDFESNSDANMEKCLFRLGQEFKFLTKTASHYNLEEVRLNLLYFFCQKILLVDFDEKSESSILKILQTCKNRNIKIILIGVGEIDRKKIPKLHIMENLLDLSVINQNLFRKILKDILDLTTQEVQNWLMHNNSIIGTYDANSDYIKLQLHLNFFHKILKGFSISKNMDKLNTEEFYQKLIDDEYIKEEKQFLRIDMTVRRSDFKFSLDQFLYKLTVGQLVTTNKMYTFFKNGSLNVSIKYIVLSFLAEFLLNFFKQMIKKYETVC